MRYLLLAATAAVAALALGPAPASDTKPNAEPAAKAPADPAPAAGESVLIEGVPHVRQKPDFCGEACVEMYCRKLGKTVTQDDVFNSSGVDPLLGRGCYAADLARAAERLGFKPAQLFVKVDADKAETQMANRWRALHADLARGVPSIVCMHYADHPGAAEHFRLVVGYDARTDEVVYHEPAESDGAAQRMKRPLFLKLWPLKPNAKKWSVIRLPLEPARLAEPKRGDELSDADYAQHMMQLKAKVPPKGFTVVIERPFVVVGDGPPQTLRMRAEQTVRWAVVRLKKDYFTKDPGRILDIWLFKDKESYEKHTKEIFGDQPTTPFGYYSSRHGALIMNIATGGGTLVHEIVHPFMRANFPECPAWFNEGLASLYEQSSTRDGHIVGLTNWRLAGLQKALKAGTVPAFKDLTATTEHQFYMEDPGTNYAQARYLCYWLQEKGLLVRFYREFTAARKEDPTGYETLKKVIGTDDMPAFQKTWGEFVLKLTFP